MTSQPFLAAPRRRLTKIVDQVLDSLQDVEGSLGWAGDLNGGMLPVEPIKCVQLTLKSGELPADLSGVYLRVGPNAQIWPPKKRTHVFDGDGMVHSVRIHKGLATYSREYLQTPRLQIERDLGEEWFPKIGEFHGKSGLAKILMIIGSKGRLYGKKDWETSTANTAIGFTPDGKLWALNEGGAPFRFRLDEQGQVQSVGYDTLSGTHENPISAHPKFDPRTGETFFHGKLLSSVPPRFYVARAQDGQVLESCDLKMPAGFNHDMFITENYVCMIDGALRFTPQGVVQKKPLWVFDPKAKLRFAIFPRNAGKMTADKFIWIECPVAADIVHTLFAYEDGNKIVLWAPASFYQKGGDGGNTILGDQGPLKMHRVVIDVEQRTADIQMVPGAENMKTEFPRIREDRFCRSCRYGFSAVQSDGADFNFTGICKWDFQEFRLAGVINFPDGVVGGEPVVFDKEGCENDEAGDVGYIGLFLWNHQTTESSFAIFDAQSFSSTPVVELSAPCRVPLGFHAAWINERQFHQQLSAP